MPPSGLIKDQTLVSKPQTRAGPPSPLLHHIFYIGTSKSSAYSNILIDLLGTGFTSAQFYKFTRGPEGPARWPKAMNPLQELEVGACRALYLLVF